MNKNNKRLAIVSAATVTGMVAVASLVGNRSAAPSPGDMPLGLGPFYTNTPGTAPVPTATSTPDANWLLPIPQATAATRTAPGDHYPTAVAWVQSLIAGTPDVSSIEDASPYRVEVIAPSDGDGFGAMVRPTDIAGYLKLAGGDPQGTPSVQGYFLSKHGTPPAGGSDPQGEYIAIITTFWGQATPVPFPTSSRWFDPTAQAVRIIMSGDDLRTDPLVFVFSVTSDGYKLVSVLDGREGYEGMVRRLQRDGWGPYYAFTAP